MTSFAILGVSVDDLNLSQFRNEVTGFLRAEDRETAAWKWFAQRLYYERGDFADSNVYFALSNLLGDLDRKRHTAGNYLFYLGDCAKVFRR